MPEDVDVLYARAKVAHSAVPSAQAAADAAQAARRAAFAALQEAGESFSSIGHYVGISGERVRQIVRGPARSND